MLHGSLKVRPCCRPVNAPFPGSAANGRTAAWHAKACSWDSTWAAPPSRQRCWMPRRDGRWHRRPRRRSRWRSRLRSPGWAEQDPDAWWRHVVAAAAGLRAKAGGRWKDVRAIGIAYQMHGLVAVDRAGRVRAGHHLVRQPRGGHRRRRLRGARPGSLPAPAAELAGQLHRRQARVGEDARTRGLRSDRSDHASRRLRRLSHDGRGAHHGLGALRGRPVGLRARRARALRARPLRHPAHDDPRHGPDLRAAGHAACLGGRRAGTRRRRAR